MFKHVLFFYVIFFLSVQFLNAKNATYVMNDQCLKAQKLIHELKFEEAEKILTSESTLHPENIAIPWLSESILFLKLFISEDAVLYKKVDKEWSTLISQVHKTEYNNAWYRFILSDMHIHRGLIRLKFNENLSAGSDIQSAHKYLKENKKMFPSFLPDNKNYGFLICAFSSVPAKYQWLAKLVGFQGDMKEGLDEVEKYLKCDQTYKEHIYLRKEAAFIYAMLQHHLNKNSAAAWTCISAYTNDYKTNLLENYMRATVAGYNGLNDEMINVLAHKPKSNEIYPFYFMDFMMGMAKMRRLDADADIFFKIFTLKYKGKNYIKSAYRNLSWLSQIKHNSVEAKSYYSLCRKHGAAVAEEDKQAEKEAIEDTPWPAELLQARLLFDGKYYEKSLAKLNGIKEQDYSNLRFILELNYRKARIYHETEKLNDAIRLYTLVIEKGKKQTYYFAAYAALQLGFIYEKQENKEMAKTYFNLAKSGFPHNKEYSNTIEQKAKAGLKRIGK